MADSILHLFARSPLTLAAESATDSAIRSPLTATVILAFCAIAGIGTVLLLPGKRIAGWRILGASLIAAAGILLAVTLMLRAGYVNAYFWIFSAIALFGSVRVITHPLPVYSALYFVLTVFSSAGLFILAYAEFMAVALIIIYAGAILVTYTFVIMLAADAAPEETGPAGRDEATRSFVAAHDANAHSPKTAAFVGVVTMGALLFLIFDKAPLALEKRLSVTDPAYMVRSETALQSNAALSTIAPTGTALPVPTSVALQHGFQNQDGAIRGDLYGYDNRLAYAQEHDRGGVQVLGIYLFTRQMVALQIAGLILTVAMIGAIVIARRRILTDASHVIDPETDTMNMPFTPVNDNPHSLPVHGTGTPRQKAYPQN